MPPIELDEAQGERWEKLKRGELAHKFGKSNRGRMPKITREQYIMAKNMLDLDDTVARVEVDTKLSRYQISKLIAGKYDFLF